MTESRQLVTGPCSVQRSSIPKLRQPGGGFKLVFLTHGVPAKKLPALIRKDTDRRVAVFKMVQQSLLGHIRQDLSGDNWSDWRLRDIVVDPCVAVTAAMRFHLFAVHALKHFTLKRVIFAATKIGFELLLLPSLNRLYRQLIAGGLTLTRCCDSEKEKTKGGLSGKRFHICKRLRRK